MAALVTRAADDHCHGEDVKRCGRAGSVKEGNSRQTFQGSAGASPCLQTGTAKHGPAEKAGCLSGTADESESQKEGCAHAYTQAAPPEAACQPSPSAFKVPGRPSMLTLARAEKGREEDFPNVATKQSL